MPMRKAAWIYLLCDIYSYSATRQVRAIGSVRKKSLESLGFAGVSSSSCGCAAVRDTTSSSARTRGRLPWCHLALFSDWCNSKFMGSFCLILKDIVSIFISLLCHTHRMKKNKSLTALGFLQTLFLLLSPARLWVQLSMDDCDPTSHTPWAAWQQHLQLRGSHRSQAAAGCGHGRMNFELSFLSGAYDQLRTEEQCTQETSWLYVNGEQDVPLLYHSSRFLNEWRGVDVSCGSHHRCSLPAASSLMGKLGAAPGDEQHASAARASETRIISSLQLMSAWKTIPVMKRPFRLVITDIPVEQGLATDAQARSVLQRKILYGVF